MSRHLGILGGGQLGRMLAIAARPLGIDISVVDPSPTAPADPVARHIEAAYDDPAALKTLAQADCITFEFENVPDAAARTLAEEGIPVFPSPEALRVAQDRFTEKSAFEDLAIPTTRFFTLDSLEDAKKAFATLGPLVMKTRRFGYDGKGQAVVREEGELEAAYASLKGAPAIAEELVPFDREVSVIVCRGRDGQSVVYPVTDNTHEEGMLRVSVAPAPGLTPEVRRAAHDAARKLVNHFDYVGVLALELFVVGDKIIANEFAPRVHNSGHWTIEGSRTSQFENHVRAVCGLPLGSPDAIGHSVMVNLIGDVPDAANVLAIEDAHLHDYGKEPRPGRKVGHVTVRATTAEAAAHGAEAVHRLIDRQ